LIDGDGKIAPKHFFCSFIAAHLPNTLCQIFVDEDNGLLDSSMMASSLRPYLHSALPFMQMQCYTPIMYCRTETFNYPSNFGRVFILGAQMHLFDCVV
jgi:hypothetical protein